MKKILLCSILTSLFSYSLASDCLNNLKVDKDFKLLNIEESQAVYPKPKDKILLTEFFWYGCPHCYRMEGMVQDFVKKHPEVEFKRYPVGFKNWSSGIKYYFTLETLGLSDKLHTASFDKIHKERVNILDNESLRTEFLSKQGVDAVKFNQTFNSFTVDLSVKKSIEYSTRYKIESAPSFVINNKYMVDGDTGKNYETMIQQITNITESLKSCKP
jgi:thiol:disulfide interchange protein DsbA